MQNNSSATCLWENQSRSPAHHFQEVLESNILFFKRLATGYESSMAGDKEARSIGQIRSPSVPLSPSAEASLELERNPQLTRLSRHPCWVHMSPGPFWASPACESSPARLSCMLEPSNGPSSHPLPAPGIHSPHGRQRDPPRHPSQAAPPAFHTGLPCSPLPPCTGRPSHFLALCPQRPPPAVTWLSEALVGVCPPLWDL